MRGGRGDVRRGLRSGERPVRLVPKGSLSVFGLKTGVSSCLFLRCVFCPGSSGVRNCSSCSICRFIGVGASLCMYSRGAMSYVAAHSSYICVKGRLVGVCCGIFLRLFKLLSAGAVRLCSRNPGGVNIVVVCAALAGRWCFKCNMAGSRLSGLTVCVGEARDVWGCGVPPLSYVGEY